MSLRIGKAWRDSASVILAAKTTLRPDAAHDFNYKILALKRSVKSGFMPATHVFPGGAVEPADYSRDWLELYDKFGFKSDGFLKFDYKRDRLKIFQHKEEGEAVPRFLSLRIAAIRETFEECGVLICRSVKKIYNERFARYASFIEGKFLKKWQKIVHDDPHKLLDMCEKFEIYPDVWALKEWSNWTTPPAIVPLRYDTVFFIASFLKPPPAFADMQEIQRLEWVNPKDMIKRNIKEEILLPPPQFYEVSRLGNFLDIDHLSTFANERAKFGILQFWPYHVNTSDGIFSILPGDDLYPYEIDPQNTEGDYYETIPNTRIQHRLKHLCHTYYVHKLILKNYKPACNHVAPVDYRVDNPKFGKK